MNILNMVATLNAACHSTKYDVIMTSNYYGKYIAGCTVANIWRYPIRRRVTKASALETLFGKIFAAT